MATVRHASASLTTLMGALATGRSSSVCSWEVFQSVLQNVARDNEEGILNMVEALSFSYHNFHKPESVGVSKMQWECLDLALSRAVAGGTTVRWSIPSHSAVANKVTHSTMRYEKDDTDS